VDQSRSVQFLTLIYDDIEHMHSIYQIVEFFICTETDILTVTSFQHFSYTFGDRETTLYQNNS